jgi:hypothetical protein
MAIFYQKIIKNLTIDNSHNILHSIAMAKKKIKRSVSKAPLEQLFDNHPDIKWLGLILVLFAVVFLAIR